MKNKKQKIKNLSKKIKKAKENSNGHKERILNKNLEDFRLNEKRLRDYNNGIKNFSKNTKSEDSIKSKKENQKYFNSNKKIKQSSGESKIRQFLTQRKIDFIQECEFKDCINPNTKRKLRFDFYLPKQNICIEFDGKQHTSPTLEFYLNTNDPEMEFQNQKFRDSIKNSYCINKEIKLIRINYTQYKSIDDILKREIK